MADISNASRAAKSGGPVSYRNAILAIRATTGDVTSITYRSDVDRLSKRLEMIIDGYANDDTALARKLTMKAAYTSTT